MRSHNVHSGLLDKNSFEEDKAQPPVMHKFNEMASLVDSGGADILSGHEHFEYNDLLKLDNSPTYNQGNRESSSDVDEVPELHSKLRSQHSWHIDMSHDSKEAGRNSFSATKNHQVERTETYRSDSLNKLLESGSANLEETKTMGLGQFSTPRFTRMNSEDNTSYWYSLKSLKAEKYKNNDAHSYMSARGSWSSEISTQRNVFVPENIKKVIDQSFIVDKLLHQTEEEALGNQFENGERRKSMDLQMPEKSEEADYFRNQQKRLIQL